MEPERPIERLLRDYANQRREKAGAPAELHPATRRLLQGEIVRAFKTGHAQAVSTAPRAFLSWRRVSWALASLCVVAVAVAVFVSVSGHRTASLELARNETPSVPQAPAPPASVAAPAPAGELAQAPAARELAKAAEPAPVVAEREQTATSPPLAAADLKDKALFLRRDGLPQQSSSRAAAGAQAAAPTTAPSEPSVALNQPVAAPALALADQPASVAASALNFVRDRAPFSVLSTFRLETAGPDVRVIDADGSVYSGSAVGPDRNQASFPYGDAAAAKSAQASQLALRARALSSDGVAPQVNLQRADQSLGATTTTFRGALSPTQPPSRFFRVAGTNRTLGQLVTFTGQLVGPTNSMPWVRTNLSTELKLEVQSAGRQAVAGLPTLGSVTNGLVMGTATIGTNAEIEIKAVPTPH